MSKLYGSLYNRFEENNQFCDEIKVGTGMTEYLYSDRHAYEVIAVKDQKHVTVREYDHKHVGNVPMDNSWELVSNENNGTLNMVKRGNYWYSEKVFTADMLDSDSIETKLYLLHNAVNTDKLRAKGVVKKYYKMNVSFGVADYYYDYEF